MNLAWPDVPCLVVMVATQGIGDLVVGICLSKKFNHKIYKKYVQGILILFARAKIIILE